MKRMTILMLSVIFSLVSFAQQNGGVPFKDGSSTISNVSVSGTTLTFTVTPDDDVTGYYVQVWPEGMLEDYAIEYEDELSDEMDWYIDYYGAQYPTQLGLRSGTQTYTENLSFWGVDPGTVGEIYVMSLTADGTKTVVTETFTVTAQGGTGTAVVDLTVYGVTATEAYLTTTKNEEASKYFLTLVTEDQFNQGINSDYILDYYTNQATPTYYYNDFVEQDSVGWNNLVPGTTYYLYIFPYNVNNTLGTLDSVIFTTTVIGGTGTPEVTAENIEVSCDKITFDVSVNENVADYVISLYSEAYTLQYPNDDADSVYEYTETKYYTGQEGLVYSGVAPGNYTLWVAAANTNGDIAGNSYEVTVSPYYTVSEPVYTANTADASLVDYSFTISADENGCAVKYAVTVDESGYISYFLNYGYSLSDLAGYGFINNPDQDIDGEVTYTGEGLEPMGEYLVIVAIETADGGIVYEYVILNTPIFQGGEGDAAVTLTTGQVGATYATVTLTMNEDTKLVYILFASNDDFIDNDIENCDDAYNYCVQNNNYIIDNLTDYVLSGLVRNENYTLYAIPVNANDERGDCQILQFTTTNPSDFIVIEENYSWSDMMTTTNNNGEEVNYYNLTVNVTPQAGCETYGITFGYADNDWSQIVSWVEEYDSGWLPATVGQTESYTLEYVGVEDEIVVYAIGVSGYDTLAATMTVTAPAAGLNEVTSSEELSSLRIYPNPTTADATLSISNLTENATIVLSDMQGRTISSEKVLAGTTSAKINTANLQSGVYYVRVITANSSRTEKLIKK
ncbi:MAG: T9SS type A sorting domain-containing protein [Bacteroidales bacterium]|nr:T9SS type A sorting domain-containing protein [Bacteroidales bacterium]